MTGAIVQPLALQDLTTRQTKANVALLGMPATYPAAFGPPSVASDVFSNPQVAKRNMLWGPGTWGLNLGVHKDFHATERLTLQFGADVNNLFNHPLFSPNADAGGGGGSFALLLHTLAVTSCFLRGLSSKTASILAFCPCVKMFIQASSE